MDPTGTSTLSYLSLRGLSAKEVIGYTSPVLARRLLRNGAVPQLILLDRRGQVTGAWPGSITDSEISQLVGMFNQEPGRRISN